MLQEDFMHDDLPLDLLDHLRILALLDVSHILKHIILLRITRLLPLQLLTVLELSIDYNIGNGVFVLCFIVLLAGCFVDHVDEFEDCTEGLEAKLD